MKGEPHVRRDANGLRQLGHDMNCMVPIKILHLQPQNKKGECKKRRIEGWKMSERWTDGGERVMEE